MASTLNTECANVQVVNVAQVSRRRRLQGVGTYDVDYEVQTDENKAGDIVATVNDPNFGTRLARQAETDNGLPTNSVGASATAAVATDSPTPPPTEEQTEAPSEAPVDTGFDGPRHDTITGLRLSDQVMEMTGGKDGNTHYYIYSNLGESCHHACFRVGESRGETWYCDDRSIFNIDQTLGHGRFGCRGRAPVYRPKRRRHSIDQSQQVGLGALHACRR